MILLQVDLSWAANQSMKDRVREKHSACWQIMADRMSYSDKEGIYAAEGNVVLTSGRKSCQLRAVYNEKREWSKSPGM
jgi:lipopolysaccharide export system protein LptA